MTGQQLKNSILQLAIQGKLVPQDPNDEPASKLLARIRKEKEQLVKDGKLKKKDLVTTPITDEEKPFDIPESWEWCRLGEIAAYRKGPFGSSLTKSMFVQKGPNSVKVYEQKNAIQKDWRLGDYYITQEKYHTMKGFVTKPYDIIVSCAGTIGECYQLPSDAPSGIINQALMRVELFARDMAEYWMLFFADMLNHNSAMKGAGSAIKNIPPFDVLKNITIPIPPLEEQKRIVDRFHELMPLVEQYGKSQEKLEALNKSLPEALKKSILQEAIMGRLVPQDPTEEPASALLARIRKEKEQLVKEGKLKKKDLVTTPITDEEKPFDIPESWEWCRLGEIGIFERGNGIKREETRPDGCPCVRYGEMYTHYRKNPTFKETISFTTQGVFDKCRKAQKGDLFMALTGENKKDIALAAQYIGDAPIAVGGDLCHFTVIESFALYFVYLINSTYYSSKKEILATGDIIVHISADKLGSIPIPLPPLSEQHRIVKKIEELFDVLK